MSNAALDCGHAPTARDPDDEIGGTGVAYDENNRSMCYACADAKQREQMRTSDHVMLYLHDNHVTTWSGGVMGRVTSRVARKMRTPNAHHAHERVFVRVTDLDGKHWRGSGPGNLMFVRLHAVKRPLAWRTEVSRAFSAGNYANAYETQDLDVALKRARYTAPHTRAAFVLGFFGSYSLDEIGSDRDTFDECYFSDAGNYVVNVARYTDSRAEEYAADQEC